MRAIASLAVVFFVLSPQPRKIGRNTAIQSIPSQLPSRTIHGSKPRPFSLSVALGVTPAIEPAIFDDP
jgi:hypothetical protein